MNAIVCLTEQLTKFRSVTTSVKLAAANAEMENGCQPGGASLVWHIAAEQSHFWHIEHVNIASASHI